MARLVIRTEDFQLSFKLIEALRSRNLKFEVIDSNTEIVNHSTIWFASPAEILEQPTVGRSIPVSLDSIESAVYSAIFLLRGIENSVFLTIGIDPGPYPGLAWLVDGAFIGVSQLASVAELAPAIEKLTQSLDFQTLLIRIGDGAPLIRDQIINDCLANNWIIEQVNESKTSSGLVRNNHAISALRIAANSGQRIWQQRELRPKHGDVKYIQTQSRKMSNGHITISKQLALLVAKGELTMQEAILEQSSYSSEE